MFYLCDTMKTQYFFSSFVLLLICSLSFAQIPEIPKSYQAKLEQHQAEIKTHPKAAQKKLLALIEETEKKQLHLVTIRAYEVIANHYSTKGEGKNAIEYAQKAAQLSEEYGYRADAAGMLGLIGNEYILLEMDDLAKENIQKGIEMVKNPGNDTDRIYLGNLYAYLTMLKEKSKDSTSLRLAYARKSLSSYLQIGKKTEREQFSMIGYGNIGIGYKKAGKQDSAIWAFDKLLSINQGKNAYMDGNAFMNKGAIFLETKQTDSAEIYLKRAEKIFKLNHFLNEEKELYQNFIQLYEQTNNKEKLREYRTNLLELENKQQKSQLNTAVELIKTENSQKKSITSNFYKIAIGFGTLIIALLIIVGWQRKKRLSEKAAFEVYRKNRNSEEQHTAETKNTENIQITGNEEEPKNENLNEDVEMRLLKGLEKFEKEHRYNEKGIAVREITSQLNTNATYLSIVIKKHKADNFSSYINTLRINYIVEKIENVPEYRKYKVSYLAEETGFSSAYAFSKVFKDLTGVSPSSYISLLGKEE